MTPTEFFRIPDTDICQSALDLVREHSPGFLYNHCLRTFAFGDFAGRTAETKYDLEMLFLGSALHDLGLVTPFIGKNRFEIDGADAASDFLSRSGYSDRKIAVIWDAIALHTVAGVPQRKQPEIALVQLGAGIDVGAVPVDTISPEAMEQILDEFPRLGFKKAMQQTMASVVAKKPATGIANVMGDIGRRCVDDFHIPNFCDVIEGAAFPE